MRCPFCQSDKSELKVIDSRTADAGKSIRRRRECLHCHKRFTTYERVEDPVRLTVIKRDGQRVPWDRNKMLNGLAHACYKRPVPESELIRIVDEVEEEGRKQHDREVPSAFIGEQVIERLRRLDKVAYVRFASVYRKFQTVEELMQEAQAVLDMRRFEDPTQGTLFIDERSAKMAAKPAAVNGHPPAPVDGETAKSTKPKRRANVVKQAGV